MKKQYIVKDGENSYMIKGARCYDSAYEIYVRHIGFEAAQKRKEIAVFHAVVDENGYYAPAGYYFDSSIWLVDSERHLYTPDKKAKTESVNSLILY